jgi:pilus assembly protein CpaB
MGRRALVLLVALILAGVAAFSVYMFVSGIEEDVRKDTEQVVVFRATQPIPEGQDGDLFLQTPMWQQSTDERVDVPDGFIASEEELRAIIGGKVAVGPIAQNQILTRDQWVELTVDITPLAEQIPSGKQAITISTDQVRGVNGFIQPGDRINAIVTIDIEFELLPDQQPGFGIPSGEEGEEGQQQQEDNTEVVTLTRYVLQGIPVLAVDRDVRPKEGERQEVTVTPQEGAEVEDSVPATVFTLEVDPEQAEKFVYAFENGSVWLTLVPEDFVETPTEGITINTLFEGDLVEDIFGN